MTDTLSGHPINSQNPRLYLFQKTRRDKVFGTPFLYVTQNLRLTYSSSPSDLDSSLQQILMDFVQQLISCGELTLAKALRVKHLERHEVKLRGLETLTNYQSTVTLCPRSYTLLDFKSEQIAEQMTLLDADLFMKIEIPEVLIWAQEQSEERSPNLTRFTEHFNKMSYW